MKYTILIALFLVGCPTQQQIEDEEQFRKEYRECLHDRIDLIDKVSIMKTPEPLACPRDIKGVLTPELDKAAPRDKCLYIIDRFGEGTFNDKEQAFRTCWDRLESGRCSELYDCRDDLEECRTKCE